MSNEHETPGSAVFRQSCAEVASPQDAAHIHEIADWADALEEKELCSVFSRGKDDNGQPRANPSLHIRTRHQDRNLAIGFNWGRHAQVTLYREAFRDLAKDTLPDVEELTGWEQTKSKTDVRDISDDLFELLTKAYKEAVEEA